MLNLRVFQLAQNRSASRGRGNLTDNNLYKKIYPPIYFCNCILALMLSNCPSLECLLNMKGTTWMRNRAKHLVRHSESHRRRAGRRSLRAPLSHPKQRIKLKHLDQIAMVNTKQPTTRANNPYALPLQGPGETPSFGIQSVVQLQL